MKCVMIHKKNIQFISPFLFPLSFWCTEMCMFVFNGTYCIVINISCVSCSDVLKIAVMKTQWDRILFYFSWIVFLPNTRHEPLINDFFFSFFFLIQILSLTCSQFLHFARVAPQHKPRFVHLQCAALVQCKMAAMCGPDRDDVMDAVSNSH